MTKRQKVFLDNYNRILADLKSLAMYDAQSNGPSRIPQGALETHAVALAHNAAVYVSDEEIAP